SKATMTATARQKSRSGILYNATWLRRAMRVSPLPEPLLTVTPFADVAVVDGDGLEEALQASFERYGADQTIIVTRSNRRAVDFNLAVRRLVYDRMEILSAGERLVLAKNNYFWTRGVDGVDFLANGEVAVVDAVYGTEQRDCGLFADVRLLLPDLDVSLDARLNLDSLTGDSAGLPRDKALAVTRQALADADALEAAPTTQRRVLRSDPYYNALQVKYAYAVTCHKAQGGQWASVFVDMGYIPPEAYGSLEFYRWLYTAVTRATARVTFINPVCRTR
ncbi:MAG: ATP-binding domain-containing protein, partial [Muribaculaceae bacterium]|nr:ATP-binding domain-containing protein [Muribaculaceae bacterium]